MNGSISIKANGKVLKGKAPEVIQSHIDRFIFSATMFLVREVKMRTPVGVSGAQGGLMSTIQGDVTGKGTPLVKGAVFHGAKHGAVIEKGRRAGKGMPPPGSLVRWLEVKLGLDEKTAQRIEFVVRRKIGQKGFEGAQMFEKALSENWAKIRAMAAKEGLAIVKDLNG